MCYQWEARANQQRQASQTSNGNLTWNLSKRGVKPYRFLPLKLTYFKRINWWSLSISSWNALSVYLTSVWVRWALPEKWYANPMNNTGDGENADWHLRLGLFWHFTAVPSLLHDLAQTERIDEVDTFHSHRLSNQLRLERVLLSPNRDSMNNIRSS